MTSDYRPSRIGELFFLQIGDRKQKTLMRVTEIDGENFRSTSAGVDDALTVKPPIPTIVWNPQKKLEKNCEQRWTSQNSEIR